LINAFQCVFGEESVGHFQGFAQGKAERALISEVPWSEGVLHICKEVGRGDFHVREDGEGFSKWEKASKK
jgi:hypothetical protein